MLGSVGICEIHAVKRSVRFPRIGVLQVPSAARSFTTSAPARVKDEQDREFARVRRNAIRRMDAYHKYKNWRLPQLLARIEQLEREVETAKGAQRGQQQAAGEAAPSEGDNAAAAAAADGAPPAVVDPRAPWRKAKPAKPAKKKRPFDFSKMPVRKIALRFAYDGEDYSGLASQGDGVPNSNASANAFSSTNELPTVELVLWNALCATHLVDPSKGFRGAGWARSGRTDRGVSAAGQVVSLWIRSIKVDERQLRQQEEDRAREKYEAGKLVYEVSDDEGEANEGQVEAHVPSAASDEHDPWSSSPLQPGMARDDKELDYVVAINRILPPSIRILGWSPVRPSFDARYHTRYRHYKYFFHSGPPEFLLPPPTHPSHRTVFPRLDIAAMQEAAGYLLGEHDFRNLCKVDPSKQIVNFRRRIDGVSIEKVEAGWPYRQSASEKRDEATAAELTSPPSEHAENMYVFNLRGTAFLYHQVRDIMAVLLLVGAGLERPAIVKELLNVREGAWEEDKKWLLNAGVRSFGEVKLPKGTATELEGATAAEPELLEAEASQAGVSAAAKTHNREADQEGAHGGRAIEAEDAQSSLATYPRKPEYVMAIDRPLVLWECGYRPKDVAWRSGCYDGPVTPATRKDISVAGDQALVTGASRVYEDIYETWAQKSISTEIWRHFGLAAGTALMGGAGGSGTLYEDARWPFLSNPPEHPFHPPNNPHNVEYQRRTMTLGHGTTRPLNAWKGVKNMKMQMVPEEKNRLYLETKARAKDKKAAKEAGKRESGAKEEAADGGAAHVGDVDEAEKAS